MGKRLRFAALFMAAVIFCSMLPPQALQAAQVIMESEQEEIKETEILKMLYVQPQEAVSHGGQLITFQTAEELGVLNFAQLFYRTSDGGEQSMSATEIAGSYAAFLITGEGISEKAITKVAVILDQKEYIVNLNEYKNDSETVSVQLEEQDISNSSGERSADEITSEQMEAVDKVVADDSSSITNALSQAQTMSGNLNRSRSARTGDVVIVLDPGHGGTDGGAARTWDGITYLEKEITLKISKYTKQELETYEGVKVYLTRTKDTYVGLTERVEIAASYNATALISQHINSTNNIKDNVSGAMVFVSKGQYRPEMTSDAHKLANKILSELEKAGFKNMGLIYNLSTNNSHYPNGALADYYTVIEESVMAGIPGMIVEHGFVNNPADCIKFFGSNTKIKKIGQADARAIAAFYGLKKKSGTQDPVQPPTENPVPPTETPTEKPEIKTGWYQVGNTWYYLKADGSKTVGWKTIDGKQYYFDSSGVMASGKKKISGTNHYFSSTGEVLSGEQTIGSARVLLDSKGVVLMNPAGTWELKGNTWYLKKTNGKYAKGWVLYKGKKCYLDTRGRMKTGWVKISGKYYYFDANGYMQTKRMTIGSTRYYLSSSGAALTGKQVINKKTVYLDSKGRILKDKWVSTSKGWRYQYASQKFAKNKWVTVSGKRYYLNKYGYMKTGWFKVGSSRYYTNSSGEAVNGWISKSGSWYYLKKGKMQTTNWIKSKGQWYYMGSDGVMYSSKKARIDKKTYRFDSTGRCTNK